MEQVKVIVKESDDVQKMLSQTASKLQEKYNKKRKINERLLKEQTKPKKVISIIFDVVCFVLVIFSALLCFSSINGKLQRTCPIFAGYSNLRIVTGSMEASGFKVGSTVAVHAVDPDTLKPGDIIAFYRYRNSYNRFTVNINRVSSVHEFATENKLVTTPQSLLGFQERGLKEAGQAGCKIYFHKIDSVYELDGKRWFKTYGTSNYNSALQEYVIDNEVICEDMIIGVYQDTFVARLMTHVTGCMTSSYGLLVLFIPIVLMAVVIAIECAKDVQFARLELDCIEEKRKITDPICVKNDVGFNMTNHMKYKILAQGTPDERITYIKYLWREGTIPQNVRRYLFRNKQLLSYNEQLLKVNRTCQERFKNGDDPLEIAKYYKTEKSRLQREERSAVKKIRKLHKKQDASDFKNLEKNKKE